MTDATVRKGKSVTEKFIHGIFLLFVTIVFAIKGYLWYSDLGFHSVQFLTRMKLMLIPYLFLAANCLCPYRTLYAWIYKYRVWICVLLFAFLVANNINFSSIGIWNKQVQPNINIQNGGLIYGTPRAIRSDEWLVNVPRMMAGSYNHFGMYNDIVRATRAEGLSATGYFLDYCALAVPDSWGYYLFGAERGLSYMWSFKMIFGFLVMFELCMILTEKKGELSTFGASVLWFSSYNMWWSLQTTMFSASASVVLFYYFITAKTKIKRCMYGVMTAIAAANFAVVLYPAWQVPFAWSALFLILWIVYKNRNQIRRFSHIDFLISALSLIFCGSLIIRFLLIERNYITAVMSTTYPGKRYGYGGYILPKAFGYLGEFFAIEGKIVNPSENSCFYLAFPLGAILLLIAMIVRKGKDSLLWALGIPMAFFCWYCSAQVPHAICEITLMTYTTPVRAVDILQYQCVLSTMAVAGRMQLWKKIKRQFSFLSAAVIAVVCVLPAIFNGILLAEGHKKGIVVIGILTMIVSAIIVAGIPEKTRKILLIAGIGVTISGLMVNPIMKGIGSITTKPVYQEVRNIVEKDPEAKWVGMNDLILQQYLISCGARTVNSVNYIPNMEFWAKFDPEGKYKNIYNRYAHITIDLADQGQETTITLVQEDSVSLKISEADFSKLDVDYILCRIPISNEQKIGYTLQYDEDGLYLYKRD